MIARHIILFILFFFPASTTLPDYILENDTIFNEKIFFLCTSYHGDNFPIPIVDFDLKPFFPKKAIKAGIKSRKVVVLALIDATGELKSAKVISKKDKFGFDEAAIQILEKARFTPGHKQREPIQMYHKIPVYFELED